MKPFVIILIFSFCTGLSAQEDTRISTLDFVQVQNANHAEALHYYQNNWKVLREKAVEKKYIHAYEFLQVEASESAPFHFILITTYTDAEQYKIREENFAELIKERGALRLKNEKQPGDFRKIIFSKEEVKHLK